jgi:16S rRNA (adenine(1408)-N(1))-methyltransferase
MRRAARNRLANAIFVWASVEQLPPGLTGVTELHVIMPWGSLLRSVLGGDGQGSDPAVLAGLADACVPGARLFIALNLHAWRPPVPEVGTVPEPTPRWALDELAGVYAKAGWRLETAEYLDDPQIDGLHSSWTKRLRAPRRGRFGVLALRGVRVGGVH